MRYMYPIAKYVAENIEVFGSIFFGLILALALLNVLVYLSQGRHINGLTPFPFLLSDYAIYLSTIYGRRRAYIKGGVGIWLTKATSIALPLVLTLGALLFFSMATVKVHEVRSALTQAD